MQDVSSANKQRCERDESERSVAESEHVLAQSNVWEIGCEKQMAALKTERAREGGVKSDDEPKYNIYHLCWLCAHPPS